MQGLTAADIKSIFLHIKTIVDLQKETLTELDSIMGDGDLGITMTRAFAAANEEATRSAEDNPGKLLAKLGIVIAKTSPSTMGTLVASGLMKGGKAIEQSPEIGMEELAVLFETFVKSIMERGKSAPGNKTIIDTLYPAALALRSASDHHETLREGIKAARAASLVGLEASTQMRAQYGRASYYQEKSIGLQDGGATVGTLIIEGFYLHLVESTD
jgi:phosphoenolpyruvate---glycerone phosphotransferase subunit DhaL